MAQNNYATTQEDFLKSSDDPSLTFRKRQGTTDLGKTYEDTYMAHLVLKLVADDNIKDFLISSNHADYGAFDDVVVETENVQGDKKMYAVQLKHAENVKTLSKDSLTKPSGNFSIQKYYGELETVKIPEVPIEFIIFTNQRFSARDKDQITLIKPDKENPAIILESCPVEISRSRVESLINTSDKGNAYQFKANQPGSKYDDFFEQLVLYTNQVNVHNIKATTSREFQERFACGEDIFEKYLQFVKDWSIFDGLKPKLTKSLMTQVITILVLSPLVTPLSFQDDEVTEQGRLLRDAMSKFQVTVCSKDHINTLQRLWQDGKSKFPANFGTLKKAANKFKIIRPGVSNVKQLNDDESGKLLWLMGVCPLVVPDCDSTRKVIKLCPHLRFVVLNDNPSLEGFTKLSDLKTFPHVFDNVISKFEFSMQGKEKLPLETLININEQVVDIVTTNELLQMSEGSFVVGGHVESLPPCHVTRRLSKNIVDCQTLLRIENAALFISGFRTRSEFNSFKLVKVDEQFFERHHHFDKGSIYVVEEECPWLLFHAFCESIQNANNSHHFRQVDDHFEYISSKGNFAEIRSHLQEGAPVNEQDLGGYEFRRSLNIICADPGMGKTTLMQSLKNHISSELWTVLIYARSHSRHFRAHQNDLKQFQEYVLANVKKNCSDFDTRIFEIMMAENLVRYIWDGLDEVSSANVESVLGVIGSFREKGLQQWVTSRNNMKDRLENLFKVPSVTLKEFDDNEQKRYIQDRLECTEEQMVTIFDKVRNNIQLFPYNDILGIPLQIYIITELFRKNMQKYLVILDEIFTIADLYDHFVDEKFQVYNIDKEKADDDNDLVYERTQQEKTTRVYQYEKAALTVHVPHDFITAWKIKNRKFLQELQDGKDRFGIIISVDEENQFEFVHNSFGEYFTAQYLSKHLERVPATVNFLFDDKHSNIRFFFDLLLAANKAHIAVLYRNPELLSKCPHEEISAKDKAGRNSLQLISSWGVRCPILPVEKEVDRYVIDETGFEPSRFSQGEKENYRNILSQLTRICKLDEADDLFQMTSFSYASKTASFLSLAMLTCQSSILSEEFKTNSILVFFYSTLADYDPIFKVMQTPRIKGLEFNLVDTQSVKCLREILPNQSYKADRTETQDDGLLFNASKIGNPDVVRVLLDNGSNVDGKFSQIELMKPLVTAAGMGHYGIVKALLDHGADVNVKNNYGTSAIHSAVQSQHYDIVQLLIEHKAAINIPDTTMGTPLHYALANGNYEIAKLLCENGADVNQRPPHLKALLPKLRLQMIEKKYPRLAELLLEYNYDLRPSFQERVPQLKQRIQMLRAILADLQRLDDVGTTSS